MHPDRLGGDDRGRGAGGSNKGGVRMNELTILELLWRDNHGDRRKQIEKIFRMYINIIHINRKNNNLRGG